jgi:hypothetical protein
LTVLITNLRTKKTMKVISQMRNTTVSLAKSKRVSKRDPIPKLSPRTLRRLETLKLLLTQRILPKAMSSGLNSILIRAKAITNLQVQMVLRTRVRTILQEELHPQRSNKTLHTMERIKRITTMVHQSRRERL